MAAFRPIYMFLNRGVIQTPVRKISTTINNASVMTIMEARASLMEMVGLKPELTESDQAYMDSMFQDIPKKQDGLPVRSIKDSYREVVIPLGSDPALQSKYTNFYKGIRFGRIMEDLDTFAGLICYTHNRRGKNERSPLSTVTALVDRIELGNFTVSAFTDIKLTGNVTWVGTSSMEVTMDVHQVIQDELQKVMKATFLMVARNPVTGGSAAVNPLKADGPEEEALVKKGASNKLARQLEAKKSLLKTPPSQDEGDLIHGLFLQTIDVKTSTLKVRVKPENTEWMENTILKNLSICHPEQRNLYNKIFGGYLMRKAFELGWANAALYSKTRPITKVIDDIAFRKTVEIGTVLFLSSQVVYTKGSQMQVKVHAEVVDPTVGKHETSNDFHFTFDSQLDDLTQVMPKTYAESMMYLDGKRHFES
ncbi:acyl-coenzyme A thioesterase 9, mitochondrial [Patella vulgata]|uniref:acyl-coenzyme A thioesterase 9, mitochondrial n=1 Tax=Patella vulgata TaxID=6465 RepID=UPI0021806C97|nr:acyl-coenzyme A thioesterase 9, mitochondrial [Patella vulgata]XP_050394847.1 acyl-coenzyme A thioesterase 9, mitochondrial [Patella vulgata]